MITCPNCGGEFDSSLPKCPYCDYINPKGAEDKFFNELEDRREQLEELVDNPSAGGAYASELKSASMSLAHKIIVILAAIGVLVVLGFLVNKVLNQIHESDIDYSEELAWQNEHFAELDKLYEEEKYSEIIVLLDKYEKKSHQTWNWKHYEFVRTVERYMDVERDVALLDDSDIDENLAKILVYETFSLVYKDYNEYRLDDEERAKLDVYSDKARTIAKERLGFSEKQLEEFTDTVAPEGYVEWEETDRIAKKYYKNFK